jgi:hypothetical protein
LNNLIVLVTYQAKWLFAKNHPPINSTLGMSKKVNEKGLASGKRCGTFFLREDFEALFSCSPLSTLYSLLSALLNTA